MSVNNPASWRFLTGGDGNKAPEYVAQKVFESGANGVYSPDIFIDTWYDGSPQKTFALPYCQELHRLGLLIELQQINWSWGGVQGVEDILTNNNGRADETINNTKQIIQDTKADIVQLINEPDVSSAFKSAHPNYMDMYSSFYNRAMSQYNTVKSGLTFVVQGAYHLDMRTLNGFNLVVPSGCRLVNSVHVYYWWFTGSTTPLNDPNGSLQFEKDYWSGNRAQGKIDLYNEILNGLYGVQDAINHGRTILFEESGTNIHNPLYQQFLADEWDFCVAHNIGIVCLCNASDNASGLPGGIFNSDYTLNGMGQVFQNYVNPSATITLPYQDNLGNLVNWRAINGAWNVT